MTTTTPPTAAPTGADLPTPTHDVERAERDLLEHGICAVTDVLDAATLDRARTALHRAADDDASRHVERPGFALDLDESNVRVWNLLGRDPVFADLAEHPVALRLLRAVLGWPMLLGNISGNITGPGGGAGALHADQIFVPQPWPAAPQGANAAWCLDDFTAERGATCFVPGSHLLNRLPREGDRPEPVPMEAPAGSLVVFDSRVWHRTGANVTPDRRRGAAFAWYTRPIYRTQENWFLALPPSFARDASDELLVLLGHRTEGLGLVDGRSPA